MASDDFVLFAGTANPELALLVAAELGVPLAEGRILRFLDGEVSIELHEPVRRRDVVLIQPTAPPVDPNLVELLALADACRRAAAGRITAVVPYFGYARGDRGGGRRSAITASLVASLIQASGIDHVVTVDLHADQIAGFFRIPVDDLSAVGTLANALADRLPPGTLVVSPDEGRVRTAAVYARRLGSEVVVLHKQRSSSLEAEVTRVVGDVRDRPCLIVDDMISTGGTIRAAVEALLGAGARPPFTVAATHGLFVDRAFERLDRAEIAEVVVTDSVAVPDPTMHTAGAGPRLRIVSIGPLVASAINRILVPSTLDDEP